MKRGKKEEMNKNVSYEMIMVENLKRNYIANYDYHHIIIIMLYTMPSKLQRVKP